MAAVDAVEREGKRRPLSVNCRDSVDPDGFYTFSLSTDGSGHAFTQNYCYSGDGPDHWVVANGSLESNHATWGGSSGGGGGGGTGGGGGGAGGSGSPVPTASKPTGDVLTPNPTESPRPKQPVDTSLVSAIRFTPLLDEFQAYIETCRVASFDNCYQLGRHFLDDTGEPVTISMPQLIRDQGPLEAELQYWLRDNVAKAIDQLKSTPASGSAVVCFDTGGVPSGPCPESQFPQNWPVYADTSLKSDWYWALHSFSIRMLGDVWMGPADGNGDRPIQIRYRSFVYDLYDFKSGDLSQYEKLVDLGWAAEFMVTGQTNTEYVSTTLNALNPQSLALLY